MAHFSSELEALIRDFVDSVTAVARAQAGERVRAVLAAALPGLAAAAPAAPETFAGNTPAARRRKIKLTPKGLAARKLQGRYLGILRGLQPGVRSRVKKVAREKGVAAAVKFAGSLK